jgi:hypothetical protein
LEFLIQGSSPLLTHRGEVRLCSDLNNIAEHIVRIHFLLIRYSSCPLNGNRESRHSQNGLDENQWFIPKTMHLLSGSDSFSICKPPVLHFVLSVYKADWLGDLRRLQNPRHCLTFFLHLMA